MRCHVLSCSGALRRLRPPCRSFVRPCPACRSSIAFRSTPFRSPRRRCPGRAEPFSARTARAGTRVGAGAVRAPDCAREAQGALLPCVSSGFFSRRREPEGEAAPRMPRPSSCPISAWIFSGQALFRNYFKKLEQTPFPGSAGARRFVLRTARLWTQTRSAAIDGQGALTVNNPARQTCRSWIRWPRPSSMPAPPTRTRPWRTSMIPTSCPQPSAAPTRASTAPWTAYTA